MPVRITVVTPSFNQAAFLEETLRSVISQRRFVHEYFVIDGGSTDGSVELIRKHAGEINYWVSEKDSGQSEAIAKGFARATGDVLAWINSDDVFLPGTFEKVLAAFEEHPEWDALTGYHVRMDAESRIISMHRLPREDPAAARWGMHHVIQQTCFFKRAAYDKVGGLDLSQHCVMDTDLWCRMFDAGMKWGHIPQYLGGFRSHATAKGVASKWVAAYAQEMQLMREKFPQYCADNLKHRLGLMVYRATQILSGRYGRAVWETWKYRGKKLDEVFPAAGTTSVNKGS